MVCPMKIEQLFSLVAVTNGYHVVVYYPLQVYVKQNKRLVLHVDKATGLAAANNDNTSDP